MAVELNNAVSEKDTDYSRCDKNIPGIDPSQTNPQLNLGDCEERHIDKVFFRSNGCWTDVRDRKFEVQHYRQYISKR